MHGTPFSLLWGQLDENKMRSGPVETQYLYGMLMLASRCSSTRSPSSALLPFLFLGRVPLLK